MTRHERARHRELPGAARVPEAERREGDGGHAHGHVPDAERPQQGGKAPAGDALQEGDDLRDAVCDDWHALQ